MKLNPPMWSLGVEVSFYALLPALGLLATQAAAAPARAGAVPLALLALGVAWNWSIAGRGLGMTFSKTLAAMLPYFALGMLAALALHGRTPARAGAARDARRAACALVLADATVKAAAPAAGIDADEALLDHPRPAVGRRASR